MIQRRFVVLLHRVRLLCLLGAFQKALVLCVPVGVALSGLGEGGL